MERLAIWRIEPEMYEVSRDRERFWRNPPNLRRLARVVAGPGATHVTLEQIEAARANPPNVGFGASLDALEEAVKRKGHGVSLVTDALLYVVARPLSLGVDRLVRPLVAGAFGAAVDGVPFVKAAGAGGLVLFLPNKPLG
ncbi:MAG: hypothetical protein AAF654_08440 [Myxococcota bacterium]